MRGRHEGKAGFWSRVAEKEDVVGSNLRAHLPREPWAEMFALEVPWDAPGRCHSFINKGSQSRGISCPSLSPSPYSEDSGVGVEVLPGVLELKK